MKKWSTLREIGFIKHLGEWNERKAPAERKEKVDLLVKYLATVQKRTWPEDCDGPKVIATAEHLLTELRRGK